VKRALLLAIALSALTLSSVPSAYTLNGVRWSSTSVPYYVNTANLDVSPTAALSAVNAAAAAWTQQTNAGFRFYNAGSTTGTSAGNNGRNEVFFRNGSSGSAIATTYYWYSGGTMLDADIVFWDGAYKFFTGSSGCSGGFYIEDVATHEFGHALGLAHSGVSGATMTSGQAYCSTTKRSLETDDKAGAEHLYPSSGTISNRAPVVTVSSPSSGATYAPTTTITLAATATDAEDGDITSRIKWTSSVSGLLGTGGLLKLVLPSGSHTLTASATDSAGVTSRQSVTISVSSTLTSSTGVVLSGRGYKTKGYQYVELRWTSASWTGVNVYRNGSRVTTTANDGSHIDATGRKGGGTYTYQICGAGTTTCSNRITIQF
jgi:hypothetical protein